MEFKFKKASKKQSKLKCAIFGPSGSGKTYSSLSIATGMSKKIAVIDTERGSASKYADRFEFDVIELVDYSIDAYVAAIKCAAHAGYEVLILDSLSHGWQFILDEVDKLAKGKFKGNSWSAWSEGTPMQKKLINCLLDYDGHIIATMRSKTEWMTENRPEGKSKPIRVGLSPEQGKGIEYEFDVLIEISTDHIAEIIKDRTGKFQDKNISKPGVEFGQQLIEWLNDGEVIVKATAEQLKELDELIESLKITSDKFNAGLLKKGFKTKQDITEKVAAEWIKSLTETLRIKQEKKDTESSSEKFTGWADNPSYNNQTISQEL